MTLVWVTVVSEEALCSSSLSSCGTLVDWFYHAHLNYSDMNVSLSKKSPANRLFVQQFVQTDRMEKHQSSALLPSYERKPLVTFGFFPLRASHRGSSSISYTIRSWRNVCKYIHQQWKIRNQVSKEKRMIISLKITYPGTYKYNPYNFHDDVIKWKHFPLYWPFVWGNSPATVQQVGMTSGQM